MASTLALSPIRRKPASRRRGNQSLVPIAALFILVVIVEAVVIWIGAPSIADIGSLYAATT